MNHSNGKFGERNSAKPSLLQQGPLASGLSRRAFLRATGASALLMGLMACKPEPPPTIDTSKIKPGHFSKAQKATLDAVLMQLFPDDGDGPSARDINALDYLQWALTDEDNINDGDQAFIEQGIIWLDDLAEQSQGAEFVQLNQQQQQQILSQVTRSREGENWMSLLLYYLTEALLLDPIYGGNPQGIGWQWLKHQPGFPRPPSLNRGYRNFE